MSFIKGYCAFIFYYISINKSFFKLFLQDYMKFA